MFFLGFALGTFVGFWGAVVWNHWLELLYEPKWEADYTDEAADAYLRGQR